MKYFLTIICLLLITISCTSEDKEKTMAELLVGFKTEVNETRAQEIFDDNLLLKLDKIKGLNIYKVKPKTTTDIKKLIEKLTSYPEVKYAEPNYKVKAL